MYLRLVSGPGYVRHHMQIWGKFLKSIFLAIWVLTISLGRKKIATHIFVKTGFSPSFPMDTWTWKLGIGFTRVQSIQRSHLRGVQQQERPLSLLAAECFGKTDPQISLFWEQRPKMFCYFREEPKTTATPPQSIIPSKHAWENQLFHGSPSQSPLDLTFWRRDRTFWGRNNTLANGNERPLPKRVTHFLSLKYRTEPNAALCKNCCR